MRRCSCNSRIFEQRLDPLTRDWGYFCMRCGKAGFDSKAKAVGHQSQCKANDLNLGFSPPPTTTDHHHTTTILPSLTTTLLPPETGSVIERQMIMFGQQLSEIKQKQDILSNETTHMVAMNNQDFFSGKGLLILVVIGVVAYLLGRENSSCDCSTSGTARRTKSNGLGSAMAGKIAGKFIDKVF